MRRLVIETSGADCSIALIEDGEIVAERHEHVGRGHAERLIPWIAALPGGGLAKDVVVGCGPGSFTGVRIAIAPERKERFLADVERHWALFVERRKREGGAPTDF